MLLPLPTPPDNGSLQTKTDPFFRSVFFSPNFLSIKRPPDLMACTKFIAMLYLSTFYIGPECTNQVPFSREPYDRVLEPSVVKQTSCQYDRFQAQHAESTVPGTER